MPVVRIPAGGWKPRPYQMKAWLAWEGGLKRSSLWWHRRAGKDELALHKMAVSLHPAGDKMPNARIANGWHMLPEYAQARKAIWTAINPHTGKLRIDEAFPHELRSSTRNDDMSITFKNGSAWRVVGSDNPNSLVGASPFGIIFSEWALSNPSTWGYLQPMLLENGGWADFITTPRGKNHAYALHKAAKSNPLWFCETLTIDDTGTISQIELAEVRKDYTALYGEDAAEALIQQEYYCSAEAAILGAYYGKEMAAAEREGRIREVDPDARYAMHTAWDLGVRKRGESDSMVIWFWQVIPGLWDDAKIKVVGCYSSHGYGIGHYAQVIHEYRKRVGCAAGVDYVPHDARQREMGAFGEDNVAKQRLEVMIECGLYPKVVQDHSVADGISAARQIFSRCWFDDEACEKGLEGLRQYQTEWDDEKKIFSSAPLKSWAADYADAFRIMAMGYREVQAEKPKPSDRALTIGPKPVPGFGLPTYNDLARLAEDEPRRRERI